MSFSEQARKFLLRVIRQHETVALFNRRKVIKSPDLPAAEKEQLIDEAKIRERTAGHIQQEIKEE